MQRRWHVNGEVVGANRVAIEVAKVVNFTTCAHPARSMNLVLAADVVDESDASGIARRECLRAKRAFRCRRMLPERTASHVEPAMMSNAAAMTSTLVGAILRGKRGRRQRRGCTNATQQRRWRRGSCGEGRRFSGVAESVESLQEEGMEVGSPRGVNSAHCALSRSAAI